MKLYSTENPAGLREEFAKAIFQSMPPDGGLYMPERVPYLGEDFFENIDQYTLPEIAFHVAKALLAEAIPEPALKQLIDEAINFDAPAVPLDESTYVLELFRGPSLAFKDFGARFMSRVMAWFLKEDGRMLDVLVATSGDTGGAVALGFLDVPHIRVTILYPRGKVSDIQELQLCTNGRNIRAVEVEGTFDDCQSMVKQAFSDKELNMKLQLTSANSINIARLIPQTFYYFYAYAQLKKLGKRDVIFSVPSGNFGNIAAGLLAYKMGLPVKRFIAATNVNDTVPRYLETGLYETRPSVQTYSNAMDVGTPSNWTRIMDLFDRRIELVQGVLSGYRFTDQETLEGIEALFSRFNYIACPHTAIAWLALEKYRNTGHGESTGVFLSTAHACKFPDIFPEDIRGLIDIPVQVRALHGLEKQAVPMPANFPAFKEYLMNYM